MKAKNQYFSFLRNRFQGLCEDCKEFHKFSHCCVYSNRMRAIMTSHVYNFLKTSLGKNTKSEEGYGMQRKKPFQYSRTLKSSKSKFLKVTISKWLHRNMY